MFEKRMLRRIFGPKRDEVTGEWRRIHNEELYAVYSSRHIIRVIESGRLRWTGHVARIGERRGTYRVLVWKPEGMTRLRRPRRRWKIILKWIFKKWDWGHGLDRSGSGQGQVASSYECGSIKCGKYLD